MTQFAHYYPNGHKTPAQALPAQSGIYLVGTTKKVVYVGQAEDVSDRFRSHNYWNRFMRATNNNPHIWFRPVPVAQLDAAEQSDIRKYKPTINTQHR